MTEHFELMVPGATVAGTLEVSTPWDGRLIATVDQGDAAAVETALATAHALYRDRDGWLPRHERIAILERAASLLKASLDELALEAAR